MDLKIVELTSENGTRTMMPSSNGLYPATKASTLPPIEALRKD